MLASWRQDYNHARPHSALGGRSPGQIIVPPCSPASRPLRALTRAAHHADEKDGRDGETALDRTEKHRHARRGEPGGLYF